VKSSNRKGLELNVGVFDNTCICRGKFSRRDFSRVSPVQAVAKKKEYYVLISFFDLIELILAVFSGSISAFQNVGRRIAILLLFAEDCAYDECHGEHGGIPEQRHD
jgi:hypothetical protein